ncbi:YwmB family TATA-box binding protein [Clostridium felsineum]|uniref:Uncharacterized protein n=1 Tax=Clostridium felsineum TaxID=36839 RepID=A0A1S8KX41_9CLOT|nr:YwmB family TATA-box binding protein [Clostridium felsineum]MCR3758390.1 YwmB family TATA-box binding protein [Clostridium felsineum]URZ07943.1 hypothetical protein CLROS_033090 [Clostridium felsineum]URZ12974.1 hypothetical protein CROST_037240 [Clostridium felsineum]
MKYNKLIFCFALLIFISLLLICGHSIRAELNQDIFGDIVKDTQSNVVETGVNISFINNGNCKNVSNGIIKNIKGSGVKNLYSTVTLDDGLGYCIEFKNSNISGYIEASVLDKDKVKVDIVEEEKVNNNNLNNIEETILGKDFNCNNLQCYKYLKAKSKIKKIKNIDEKVKKILSSIRAENIKTVKLNKNLSTTAYTKKFNYIRDGNRKVDFNYSVCKYENGNFIIVGTPIIPITY